VTPLGLNDNGAILVSLYSNTASAYHWGTLKPPAAATKSKFARSVPRS
jgi:hypothetical protein